MSQEEEGEMDQNDSNDELEVSTTSQRFDFGIPGKSNVQLMRECYLTDSLSSDSESEQVESTYDPMITPTHSYLADHMEEVRGPVLFDDGAIVDDFPLIFLRYCFIHPGQLFPMVVQYYLTKKMLRKCRANKSSVFGIIFIVEKTYMKVSPSQCGIIAEILEFFDDDRKIYLKARAGQRFKLIKSAKSMEEDIATYGRIQILPEVKAKSSLECTKLAALDNHRNTTVKENVERVEKTGKRHIDRYDASLTPWPAWVHEFTDPYKLALKIRQRLSPWQKKIRIPDDPNELSYWLGRNLPMSDAVRDKLLSMTNATPRLYYYNLFLSKKRMLVCASCKRFVSKTKHMFPMTPEGLQSVYTNPNGNLFEAITLTKVSANLRLAASRPNPHYSWFPGYAWTPASCRVCTGHTGWLFTATKPDLKPTVFWALIGHRLRLRLNEHDNEKQNSSSDSSFEEEEKEEAEQKLSSLAMILEN